MMVVALMLSLHLVFVYIAPELAHRFTLLARLKISFRTRVQATLSFVEIGRFRNIKSFVARRTSLASGKPRMKST